MSLFEEYNYFNYQFPEPQYLGAKYNFLQWFYRFIPKNIKTAMDAFSGSQSVAYFFKQCGLQVFTNDFLNFNHQIGLSLIENNQIKFSNEEIEYLLQPTQNNQFNLMQNIYTDVFFTNDQAQFLDSFRANIEDLENPYKKALAFTIINRSLTRKVTMGHFAHLQALKYANDEQRLKRNPSLAKPIRTLFLEMVSKYNQAIFDIYCENKKGEKFIVELQKAPQNYFKDRSVYYSTFPIQQQAQKGLWDFKLEAVYTIGILDFVFAEDQDNQEVFHHEVKLVDQSTQKVFYDKLTYIYLEMPKFKKTEEELETHFDKWLYVLRNLEDLTKRPEKLQEKIFAQLFEQAEIANYSEQEYTEYEHSLKVYRDLNNVIETAESKGEKRGEARGEKRGKAEGKAEKAKEIARTMIAKGLDIEFIMEITQLSKEEIEQLKS